MFQKPGIWKIEVFLEKVCVDKKHCTECVFSNYILLKISKFETEK